MKKSALYEIKTALRQLEGAFKIFDGASAVVVAVGYQTHCLGINSMWPGQMTTAIYRDSESNTLATQP